MDKQVEPVLDIYDYEFNELGFSDQVALQGMFFLGRVTEIIGMESAANSLYEKAREITDVRLEQKNDQNSLSDAFRYFDAKASTHEASLISRDRTQDQESLDGQMLRDEDIENSIAEKPVTKPQGFNI